MKGLVTTPLSTIIKAIVQFVENPKLTGEIAEVHEDKVTLRPPYEFVDEGTRNNQEKLIAMHIAPGIV